VSSIASRSWQRLAVELDGEVGRITLNRPAARNALDGTTVTELEAALDELGTTARAVVVAGAGDNFCAGADLRHVAGLRDDPAGMRAFIAQINRAFDAAEACPVPVIAAVQGYALAGGFELMQACDLVLVADTAVIGDQHANFGLLPGAGGSQRLPRLVGRQRALGLLLTGDRLTPAQAVDWGLALRVVPAARLGAEATALAQRLASLSRPGLARIKELVGRGLGLPLRDAIALETEVFMEHMGHADVSEGLAAFMERRRPDFAGDASSSRR
jgi:enoyl-CoA hydratase/carnithine racemase